MSTFLWRSVIPLAGLLIAAAVVLRLSAGVSDLESLPAIERPWLIVAALVTMTLTGMSYALLWRCLMSNLEPARPPLLQSMAVFACSWLSRYVPSGAPYVASALVLGNRIGHARVSLAAALLYLNLVIACVFCLSAWLALPLLLDGGPADLVWIMLAMLTVAVLLVLPSPLTHRSVKFVASRWPRLEALQRSTLSAKGIVIASVIALLAGALNGISFAFVLLAFTDLNLRTVIAVAAVYNLAGAAGIAAVPVPSGLGVREGVLIALLHLLVPIEVATAAIVLARLLAIVVDVGTGLFGAVLLVRANSIRSDDASGVQIAVTTAARGR
jgi:uncharacterized membrane protein YbhN (UPF0104 family)